MILSGKKPAETAKHVELQTIVGKTIAAVEVSEVDGASGKEPCIYLWFTDETKHGFVIAQAD